MKWLEIIFILVKVLCISSTCPKIRKRPYFFIRDFQELFYFALLIATLCSISLENIFCISFCKCFFLAIGNLFFCATQQSLLWFWFYFNAIIKSGDLFNRYQFLNLIIPLGCAEWKPIINHISIVDRDITNFVAYTSFLTWWGTRNIDTDTPIRF